MNDEAKFRITGAIGRAPYIGEKMARMTVQTVSGKRTDYHELITFEPHLLRSWSDGDRVTCTGRVSRERIRNAKQVRKDGSEGDVFAPMLIVESVIPADDRQRPSEPQTRNRTQARAPQREPERAVEDRGDDSDIPF